MSGQGKSYRRAQGIDLDPNYAPYADDPNVLADDEEFTVEGVRIKPQFVKRQVQPGNRPVRLRRPAGHRTEKDG